MADCLETSATYHPNHYMSEIITTWAEAYWKHLEDPIKS